MSTPTREGPRKVSIPLDRLVANDKPSFRREGLNEFGISMAVFHPFNSNNSTFVPLDAKQYDTIDYKWIGENVKETLDLDD